MCYNRGMILGRPMGAPLTRRQFVATAASAAALAPAVHLSAGAPASSRVRIGLIGCGGRGRQLLCVMKEFPDVEFPMVSDVIESRLNATARLLADGPLARKPECVVEYERILDRNDIDAVLIATPQHWHGLPFIQAAQAGKHIYVEKPLSHTVAEGRAMVEAARKSGVIAMMGTEQRGAPHYIEAVELIHAGRLGQIALVESWNYDDNRRRVGRRPDGEPPPGFHWDRWLGPAPCAAFNHTRLASSWWFDYGGGMLTDGAIHHIDIILWAMKVGSPTSAVCSGGKFTVDDAADTPDTIDASWEYPGFVMRYSYRGFGNCRTAQNRPYNHGICFYGDRAAMVLDRSGFEIWDNASPGRSAERHDSPRRESDGKPGNEVDGPWQRLFVDCVKQRRKPPVELEHSHQATVCSHLGNIAYLTGRKLHWKAKDESIAGDPEAALRLWRPRRQGYELPKV